METKQTQFMIYRDGNVDKAFLYRTRLRKTANNIGHFLYKSADVMLDAIDELVAAAQ